MISISGCTQDVDTPFPVQFGHGFVDVATGKTEAMPLPLHAPVEESSQRLPDHPNQAQHNSASPILQPQLRPDPSPPPTPHTKICPVPVHSRALRRALLP